MKKICSLFLLLTVMLCLPLTLRAEQLNEGFEDATFAPDGWTSIHVSGSKSWERYSSNHHEGAACAYVMYASSPGHENYLVTPKLLPADGESLSFYVASQSWGGTTLTIEVSTTTAEAASFATTLATYTTGSSGTIGTTSNSTWVEKVIDLSAYAGQEIYVAFHVVDNNGSSLYLDDVTGVSIKEEACPRPKNLALDGDADPTEALIVWEAVAGAEAEGGYELEYSTSEDFTNPQAPSLIEGEAGLLEDLTPATTYYVRVRAFCGEEGYSEWSSTFSFKTKCVAVSAFPWSENFDDITAGSGVLPDCWNRINNSSSYGAYPYVYEYSSYAHSGTNSLYFYTGGSSYYADQYAVLPEMSDLDGKRIVFWARGYNSTSKLKVGRMSNPADASTFVQIGEDIALTTSYQKYAVNMEESGDYIAIMVANLSSYSYNGAYIDDIVVEEVPSCLEPSGLAFVSSETNSAILNWEASESGESEWDIYYSTENVAPTAETAPIIVKTSAKEIPNGLNPSSTYYVWVRAHCNDSDQSPWVGGISFQTECDAVSALNENFNGYTGSTSASVPAGYPDDQLPTCWQFLNRAASSNSYPQVFISSTSGYAVSGNCLFFKSSSTTPLYAILPELAENISVLQLTFTYRNEGTGSSNGTLYVGYLTDPADASTFVSVDTCEQTTTLTEQEVLFADAPAGSYIAFKYQGGTSNNYYLSIDDVFVGPIPTCQKPADPKCDAKTAHTATLSWTNGAEGQNAWQIVVDTIAAFNPDTVNAARIIDVASNPAIIDGLLSSKTYYAYVRANCGEDGFSAWSKKKVTFTTIAGNIAPSGLAVDGASLASDAATVTWVSAKNDLHADFELFYSKINELPETPEGDSLFTNIADTFKVLSGLDAETTYYVWVRDNCGADGNSAWVSFSFTTLANCPVPGELSASEVAAHSAKIAWNVGTNDSYNVRYRTAALDNVLLEQGFEDGMGGWTTSNPASSTGISSSANHSGTYGFSFHWGTPPQYLISPEIAGIDADATLEFYYKNGSATWAETFQVGYSTTTNAPSAFTFGDEITASDNEWHKYSGIVPAGTKYISIKCTSDDKFYLYIDDIVLIGAATPAGDWTVKEGNSEKFITISGLEPETKYEAKVQGVCGVDPTEWSESVFFTTTPSCIKPASLDAEVLSANSVKLDWTAGGEETFFQVVCVLSGEEPNWEGVEPIEALTITIDTLNLDNDYDFYVRAYCGESDHSDFRMVSAHVGYCVPAPTSIDGSGIIAIAFNEEDAYTDIHPTAAPFYADNKAIEFVAHADEIDSILITYSTGYTYGTVIWVDWNKNLAFEASEVVFSGESSESKPTTLSCVFTIPAETELGAYRLRIGGADSFFNGYINGTSSADPDPCGTGTYTIYEDYTLLIVEKPHDPTGLSGAGIENVAIKRIENDQVVIIRNGEKFTIMGVKIQ